MDKIKEDLRKKGKDLRNNIGLEVRIAKSQKVAEHFLQSTLFEKAETVFSYLPIGSELDTLPILENVWQKGKRVAVPVTEKNRQMSFVVIDSLQATHIGNFGIREPKKGKTFFPKSEDVILVPALFFDHEGNRLGYGGGYYDTYFAQYPLGRKVGICFQEQIISDVMPVEKTDYPVENILTENGWIKVKEK